MKLLVFILSIPLLFAQQVCLPEREAVKLVYELERLRAFRKVAEVSLQRSDSVIATVPTYQRIIGTYKSELDGLYSNVTILKRQAQECLEVHKTAIGLYEGQVKKTKSAKLWRNISLGANVALAGALITVFLVK